MNEEKKLRPCEVSLYRKTFLARVENGAPVEAAHKQALHACKLWENIGAFNDNRVEKEKVVVNNESVRVSSKFVPMIETLPEHVMVGDVCHERFAELGRMISPDGLKSIPIIGVLENTMWKETCNFLKKQHPDIFQSLQDTLSRKVNDGSFGRPTSDG